MNGSTTSVYPAEHPAMTELHRSYAHAAALGRTVTELRAIIADRDATISARNATIADLSDHVATLRQKAAHLDVDVLLTRSMGELAATQVRITANTVRLRNPIDVAFNQTIVAVLAEQLQSFCAAREVYREHRPDTGPLLEWLIGERWRWLDHTDTTSPADDERARRSAEAWAHEAGRHITALGELYQLLAGHPIPAPVR